MFQPNERVFNTLPIEIGDFAADELQKSINASQNKAPGLDETGCFDEKLLELLEICNKTLHGDVPGTWLRGGIQPFPKKKRFRRN